MGLKLEELRNLEQIVKDAEPGDEYLTVLVMQVKLLNMQVNALNSIDAALERIAGRMS